MKNTVPYTAIIFDLFGVLLAYRKSPGSLLKMGALNLHLELGGAANIFTTIQPGVDLLSRCAVQQTSSGSQKYRLYLCSNIKQTAYAVVSKKYPEIFSLFDGIVTSGECGLRKPDPQIFEYLLDTYGLEPEECIFIDDKRSSIHAAEHLGITGIVFDDPERVRNELKILGVLS